MLRGLDQARKLLVSEPLAFLLRLGRRLQFKERVGCPLPAAEPCHEAPQQHKAPIVGRWRWVAASPVGVEVIHDRLLIEQILGALLGCRPCEQVIDGDAVGADRALAALRASQAPQPSLAVAGDQVPRTRSGDRPHAELDQRAGEHFQRRALIVRVTRLRKRDLQRSECKPIGRRQRRPAVALAAAAGLGRSPRSQPHASLGCGCPSQSAAWLGRSVWVKIGANGPWRIRSSRATLGERALEPVSEPR